uniref:Plastocyanin n=1 Tax=Ulva prolifera TaxID=3117 RepID=PLAS_ULVPR|nr:RecName: Full=Plastocyanin [Ulva prolifera]7PCY_A Chain A, PLASTOCYANIN [Ulva prolifera]
AAIVKLGGDDGSLAFVPNNITVGAGESIEFINNAGFPHNIVFDEDAVPAGVDADAISAEDYLNSKGQTVVRKLTTPGTYGVYCDPHSGAGMKMTITVQ